MNDKFMGSNSERMIKNISEFIKIESINEILKESKIILIKIYFKYLNY